MTSLHPIHSAARSRYGGAEIARPDNAAPDQTDRNGLNIRRPEKKNRTCWMISELNPVCHDSTAALTVACSFCVQSAILSALIRSPYRLQPRDDNSSGSRSEDENEDRQAPVTAATTSGASESATAASTSDDCCEVCLVATRAGFALVPCGHRTRTQYTRRRNDDKEHF